MIILKDTDGMTLIELIMSLAIMLLVPGAIFSFFSAGVHSWNITDDKIEVQQNARVAFDRISQDLKIVKDYAILAEDMIEVKPYMPDGKSYMKRYYLQGQHLILEKNSERYILADKITELSFRNLGDMVEVHIVAQVGDHQIQLTTQIYPYMF